MKVIVLPMFMVGVLFLCGCAVKIAPESMLKQKQKQLVAAGNSPAFISGYMAGCASGKHVVGSKHYKEEKDQLRYTTEQDYSTGWEKGYYECRDESIAKLQSKVKQENVPASTAIEASEQAKIWNEISK